MTDDLPEKRSNADEQSLVHEPKGWQIAETLANVVEKIGHSPVASSWWEIYSHGLSMPIDGMPYGERGFLARCRDATSYLQLESDFLHFDDEGTDRKYEGDPEGKPIDIGTENRLKSLALRVVAFTLTRKELENQGFALPENSDLAMAIKAVKVEVAKDARMAAQFAQLLGGEISSLERRIRKKDTKGLQGPQ